MEGFHIMAKQKNRLQLHELVTAAITAPNICILQSELKYTLHCVMNSECFHWKDRSLRSSSMFCSASLGVPTTINSEGSLEAHTDEREHENNGAHEMRQPDGSDRYSGSSS